MLNKLKVISAVYSEYDKQLIIGINYIKQNHIGTSFRVDKITHDDAVNLLKLLS